METARFGQVLTRKREVGAPLVNGVCACCGLPGTGLRQVNEVTWVHAGPCERSVREVAA